MTPNFNNLQNSRKDSFLRATKETDCQLGRSVRLAACISAAPTGISWSLILESFTKYCRGTPNLVTIE